jgi:C-terminal processing protease CtpA/Prc
MKEENSENLGQKVSQLISRIEKVTAPNDFAFKLKARIVVEKQKQAERKILLTRLSYVFSAFVFILLVVTVVYVLKNRDVELASHKEVSTFRENALPLEKANEAENEVSSNQAKREIDPKENPNAPREEFREAKEEVIAFANTNASKTASKAHKSEYKKKTSQFSRSEAVSVPEVMGLSQGNFLEVPTVRQEARISISELLKQIGIEGSFDELGGFKVKSLKPNSLAEKSGIKPEDLILAIDERKLDRQELYFEKLEVKRLKVKRKSEELSIILKP